MKYFNYELTCLHSFRISTRLNVTEEGHSKSHLELNE